MGASTVGPSLQAAGTIYSGAMDMSVANVEAQQLRINAGQAMAAGTTGAAIAAKRTALVQSSQRAIAGASGAGAADIGVQNVEAETGRTGEYNALESLYHGKSEEQNMQEQAGLTEFAGKQAMLEGVVKGAGDMWNAPSGGSGSPTLGEEGVSMLKKYGGQLPSWFGGNQMPT